MLFLDCLPGWEEGDDSNGLLLPAARPLLAGIRALGDFRQ